MVEKLAQNGSKQIGIESNENTKKNCKKVIFREVTPME